MTLFKRVFNNHTNSASSAAAVSDAPEVLEGSWAIEDDLAAEMSDVVEGVALDDPAHIDVMVEGGALAELVAEPVEHRSGGAYATPVPEHTTKLAPVATPPVVAQSLAERAALAQNAIEQTQTRRAGTPRERPEADMQVEPAPPRPALAAPAPAPEPQEAPAAITAQRPGRNARRVRTRMLGFNGGAEAEPDPFAQADTDAAAAAPKMMHPVGWMVVVAGPGEGNAFALYNGVSTIGRGSDQTVPLDFGDTSISREKHAAVAYDDETNAFFLGHGGKSNIVRLNNRPVLSTEDLGHGDTVRIGETTLRFVALCGEDFAWGKGEHAGT